MHRRYVDVGCDVISTDTWGLPTALRDERPRCGRPTGPCTGWTSPAAASPSPAGRSPRPAAPGECAVAFSLNGDVDTPEGARDDPAAGARVRGGSARHRAARDAVARPQLDLRRPVERLLGTGLPVWLSFRRCRHGVCGVYGEHWGGPEGDAFGRAARRFEQMGVGALLVNCIPPDHVGGMISWMRDFTDLPLGAYPNLGYLSTAGWRTEARVDGAEYARDGAAAGATEGAQIIGGCCGVRPEHVAAARVALDGVPPGHARPLELVGDEADAGVLPAGARTEPWRGRPRLGALPARLPRHPVRAGRLRADPGQLPRVEAPFPRGHRPGHALPGRRLRHAACSPSSWPGTAPRTSTRSTSTAAPRRTRSRTHSETASPGASAPPPSTSSRGCRRSATT